MDEYIYQQPDWPRWRWQADVLAAPLGQVRQQLGFLLGQLAGLGLAQRAEAALATLTLEARQSSAIEGGVLPTAQLRSSLARRLGLPGAGGPAASRQVEGVVDVLLDATQQPWQPVTAARLHAWQAALFPTGRSGLLPVRTGAWRRDAAGPMQVVSGPAGRETGHFQAPAAAAVPAHMAALLAWLESPPAEDPVLRAALGHLWLVTIHPYEDGNGRVARALTELLLARADGSPLRFYSLSAQLGRERGAYYAILERSQRGPLDVTPWLHWFVACLGRALAATSATLAGVLRRARFWEQHAAVPLSPRQRLLLGRLLEGFTGKLTSSKWAKMARCSQDSATRDLQGLVALGLLEKGPAGGRSTSYQLPAAFAPA